MGVQLSRLLLKLSFYVYSLLLTDLNCLISLFQLFNNLFLLHYQGLNSLVRLLLRTTSTEGGSCYEALFVIMSHSFASG